MQKIKILHIIKSLGRGGAEVLLPETLKLHDKAKFEFHYIYFLPWKNQMVKYIEEEGGIVVNFSAKNNLELILQYFKVNSYCKHHQIDLIHCHLPWSGFLGRLIFLGRKIPVIYTEHNIQEQYHFATKILNKISFNKQSLALGVSKDVTASVNRNIHPVIPVHTLLNGVDTNFFKRDLNKGNVIRKKFGIPAGAMVIGNIAVFRKQKNLSLWLETFNLINEKYPEVYGILVGAGQEEEEIFKLVQDLQLNERIILPGLQTDTVSYFSAMDIFFMSSSFEGLPIALLEAMSMECAVVSTKAGGVVEVIEDKREGFLANIDDEKGLFHAIEQLIINKSLRESMRKLAREKIVQNFSLRRMVDKLEEYYLEF